MTSGDEPPVAAASTWRRWLKWAGAAVGTVLMAAAIVTVARQHETLAAAWEAIRHPSPIDVALLLGSIVVNLVVSGLLFGVLMSRYGRVGLGEMQALMAASALLNYLPLRPGLFGRIAYHKAVNGIDATATIRVVVQAIALSVGAAAYIAVALAVTAKTGVPLWPLLVAPALVLAVIAAVAPPARIWAVAGLLKLVEILVWAVRYWAAFRLIGVEISMAGAVTFAAVGVVTMLVSVFGNGLGLREWVIGLTAPLVTSLALGQGLTAELVNRAAELVVVGIAGTAAFAWLSLRSRSRDRQP